VFQWLRFFKDRPTTKWVSEKKCIAILFAPALLISRNNQTLLQIRTMFDRRKFLQSTFLSGAALLVNQAAAGGAGTAKNKPIVISTWAPNTKANAEAWKSLVKGGTSVDAVEAGVQVPESDPEDQSVGYGGLPDRDGKVTLDACIMDGSGNCGAVMFLESIMHPVKLARLVMDKTPHVQLAGEGALQFALENGYKREELLTPAAEAAWKKWLESAKYDPMTIPRILEKMDQPGQLNNHDTIGMLAMDVTGNLAGACSSSGMAFKMRGRVGDSPIIGAGLYVDNEVGAATGSGVGEEAVRICGSHTITEFMRHGYSPEMACKKTLERLIRMRGTKVKDLQMGFIALNRNGEFGAYALQPGFTYAVHTKQGSKTYSSKSIYR
jgi:N4-(beta-N-acetylglucosaminyl)-L-asparaginase